MHRFFSPENLIVGQCLWLLHEEANHCTKTFRLKKDEKIILLNGYGYEGVAKILQIQTRQKVQVLILKVKKISPQGKILNLFFPPPQNNILSKLIKQIVELGVEQITFLKTEFSVIKKVNFDKLNKSMIEAMKQSGNHYLPNLNGPIKFEQALGDAIGQIVYGAVPDDKIIKYYTKKESEVSLFIGPEGGFSTKEKKLLVERGEALMVGKNILRIETAIVGLIAKIL